MKRNQIIAFVLLAIFGLWAFGAYFKSCSKSSENGDNQTTSETAVLQPAPIFSSDTAYKFIEKQVAFGPRVPATPQHKACGEWIEAQMKSFGATVYTQNFVGTAYNGKTRASKNIIGSINPRAVKRIIVAAHWDTRPIADKDDERQTKPILGAIDGGSGVAVALEIARQLKNKPLKDSLGVDFIFFDNEDNGTPDDYLTADRSKNFWCLGSQYWAANKHIPGYSAYFGILLDMVGGKNTFYQKEGHSMQYANSIVELVWGTAAQLGFSKFFKNENGSAITDDHVSVNEVAKIPMIDIISSDGNGGFGAFHHTHDDNLTNVSREHIKAVGQTVLQVIYNEQ